MNKTARIPYGLAKRIISTLRVGDSCIVRPQHVKTMRTAARRMSVRVSAVWVLRDRRVLYRLSRVTNGAAQTLRCA